MILSKKVEFWVGMDHFEFTKSRQCCLSSIRWRVSGKYKIGLNPLAQLSFSNSKKPHWFTQDSTTKQQAWDLVRIPILQPCSKSFPQNRQSRVFERGERRANTHARNGRQIGYSGVGWVGLPRRWLKASVKSNYRADIKKYSIWGPIVTNQCLICNRKDCPLYLG